MPVPPRLVLVMEGDHLAKLEEGVDAWNHWRAANPTVEPDLYRTYLDGANLNGVDLCGAKWTEAVLLNLTMSDANLLNTALRKRC